MLRVFLLIFILLSSLDAKESRKAFYENIDKSDDNETRATIKQFINASFNVSAHNANYFLPISYRLDNDAYGYTKDPTNPPKQTESEFQISIKYDIASNLFGIDEIYTAAYTQRSFWQTYTKSAYFRETNYNPELFVTFPFRISNKTYGVRAMRLGFAHMSNGQGAEQERSWNYLFSDMYFQLGHIFIDLKFWARLKDNHDYNPELIDYLGYGHLKFIIPYKKHLVDTIFRYSLEGYGSAELNYSYPIFKRDDLFLYLKAFDGYGESLIDYNQRIQKIGIGFSISR